MSVQAGETMRIGVDGFNLAMARGTGVATYARTLTRCLDGMGHKVDMVYGLPIAPKTPLLLREVLFYDSLGQEKAPKPPLPMSPTWIGEVVAGWTGVDAIRIPLTGQVVDLSFAAQMPTHDRIMNVPNLFEMAGRHFKRTRRFLRLRVPNPPAIMHWTYPLPILLEGARNVYTIHDLVPLRLPYTTLDNKRYYYRLIRGCLRWGDHICTVSETSRRDVLDLFGVAGDRVTNTYQSFAPPAHALLPSLAETEARVRGVFGLEPRSFFLFFGAIEPKKNVGRLIEAFLTAGLSSKLVIVGARAWKNKEEMRLLDPAGGMALRQAQNIMQLDYLPIDMLVTLIRTARAVVFPSLYEGFGLPVLEAMALGTPVLTSTGGSLPEVAGEASVAVQPYDAASIAEGLRRLDGDDALRATLVARGLVQAERFSMALYRDRLAAMYAAVLAAPPGRPMLAPEPRWRWFRPAEGQSEAGGLA